MLQGCPDTRRIEKFALGYVTGPEAEEIEKHLAQCPACATTLATNEGRDPLTDALLRAAPLAAKLPVGPAVQQLIERLSAFRTIKAPSSLESIPEEEDQRLAHYRLLGLLGQGGMGRV